MLASPLLYSGRQRRLWATVFAHPSGHSELRSIYLCSSLILLYPAIRIFSQRMPRIFFTGFCCWQCIAFLRSELIKFCLLSCLSPAMWEATPPLCLYKQHTNYIQGIDQWEKRWMKSKGGEANFFVSSQIANYWAQSAIANLQISEVYQSANRNFANL